MTAASLLRYVIVLLVLIGLGLGANALWQRHKRNADAHLDQQITDTAKQDSSTQVHLDSISQRLDTVTRTAIQYIDRWHTTTEKVYVPGRIDSVYKDSNFAKLPDSVKVKVLRELGNQAAQSCAEGLSLCRQFKDSAYTQFHTKDREINLWHDRFDNKPRRACGLGVSGGPGALVDANLKPHTGFGVVAGFTCNF